VWKVARGAGGQTFGLSLTFERGPGREAEWGPNVQPMNKLFTP